MADLVDYSGEFRPNIKYQDFSKEALARLLTQYARLGLALDGWWQNTVMELSLIHISEPTRPY